MKFHFHKVIVILLFSFWISQSFGQDSGFVDIVRPEYWAELEIGINALGVGLEGKYHLMSILTADLILGLYSSMQKPSLGVGISFMPVRYVFAQGLISSTEEGISAGLTSPTPPGGIVSSEDLSTNYAYGMRAGVHFPIVPRKGMFFISMWAGNLTFVRNGGSTRTVDTFGGGLVLKF